MASAIEIRLALEAGKAGLPFKFGNDPALNQAYTQGLALRQQLKSNQQLHNTGTNTYKDLINQKRQEQQRENEAIKRERERENEAEWREIQRLQQDSLRRQREEGEAIEEAKRHEGEQESVRLNEIEWLKQIISTCTDTDREFYQRQLFDLEREQRASDHIKKLRENEERERIEQKQIQFEQYQREQQERERVELTRKEIELEDRKRRQLEEEFENKYNNDEKKRAWLVLSSLIFFGLGALLAYFAITFQSSFIILGMLSLITFGIGIILRKASSAI
jgi:hypothetical protein